MCYNINAPVVGTSNLGLGPKLVAATGAYVGK